MARKSKMLEKIIEDVRTDEKEIVEETSTEKTRRAMATSLIAIEQIEDNFESILKAVMDGARNGIVSKEQVFNMVSIYSNLCSEKDKLEKLIQITDIGIMGTNKCNKPKVPEYIVHKVLCYYKTGDFKQTDLAKMFGYSQSTIAQIIRTRLDEEL
ncbi:hypothetical protein DLH72_04505 [Candidatus Gracilibacteria bacterium]|nr:MAG: hypothetical protein DLH72_04505 [Candidatus Gracilibacteria bacterium]